MSKYIILDSNLILSLNVICTSVMFTHFLNASVIQYPTMMRNKHDWSTSLERTFFTFIAFAVGEVVTDIYVVYKLRVREEFEYYLRLGGLCVLLLGWFVSIFIIRIQLELAYDSWTVPSYNSLLTWNWLRTALWGVRFSMVVFNVVCEIREEEPDIALPKRRQNGYVSSLDQKNDVFTFEDSDE